MLKKILSVIIVLSLCVALSVTALAADSMPRLYDGADLLTAAEESELKSRMDEVSEKFKVEIVIATFETIGDAYVDDFVESYYDDNQFGFGENHDGVLLLIDMGQRDLRIISNGLGGDAISEDDIEYIGDQIAPYLSDGDYAAGFHAFVDSCEYEINGEINGFPFDPGANLLISLVIGFVVALIVTGSMKSQLKSVRKQQAATAYTKPGSMKVTTSTDLFLYRTLNRRKKETTTTSRSSRSSGSSGPTRNVGGRKF